MARFGRFSLMVAAVMAAAAISMTSEPAAAFTIKNSAKSSESIVVVGQRFQSPAKWEGRFHCKTSGSFVDPRNHGECWKCPSDHKRTIFAVTSDKACQKEGQVLGGFTNATKTGKANYCPTGAFRNALLDQCYSCPAGFDRSLRPGADLTKLDDACIGRGYFYRTIKPGESAEGKPSDPLLNVTKNSTATLRFSAYSSKSTCGWHDAPSARGAPASSPTQKACEVVSFTMRASETAVVQSSNGASALIHDAGGTAYKLFCKPQQPPSHSDPAALRCRASEQPIDQYH